MAYDSEDARQAARKRLQERIDRQSAEQSTRSEHAPSTHALAVRKEGFHGKRVLLIAGAAALAIALLVLAAVALPECSIEETAANEHAESIEEQQRPAVELDRENAAQAKLIDIIGTVETEKLLTNALGNSSALWIAAHPDEYAPAGPQAQVGMLQLAADEPEAIDYVRAFPERYPANKPANDAAPSMAVESPTPDVPGTSVPHLYQWDARWGYTKFGSVAFGLAGSAPTSFAMAVRGLTDSYNPTPFEIGQLAIKHRYLAELADTGLDFFINMADEFELYCEQLYPTGESIVEALSNGAVIIANIGQEPASANRHFSVLAGLTDDGRVIVNDPASVQHSSQTWDANTLADESLALFAFSPIN